MNKEKKSFKDTVFGKIISKAGSIIPDAAGITLKATVGGNPMGAVKDAVKALTGSKDPIAKELLSEIDLRMAEIELEFSKVELEETKAYLGDVQNARLRDIKLTMAGKKNWFQKIIGAFGIIIFSFCVYVLVYKEIPESNRELFVHLMGILEGIILSIYNYEFGSSKGSKDKTESLSRK